MNPEDNVIPEINEVDEQTPATKVAEETKEEENKLVSNFEKKDDEPPLPV